MYQRATYNLRQYSIVAPEVHNDGTPSNAVCRVRAELKALGFNWMETAELGFWEGHGEPGILFTIYAPDTWRWAADDATTVDVLAKLARRAMPDQDAIQVTMSPAPYTLIEA